MRNATKTESKVESNNSGLWNLQVMVGGLAKNAEENSVNLGYDYTCSLLHREAFSSNTGIF